MQDNYFTGTVPATFLTRFGNSSFGGNCLTSPSIAQRVPCDDPYNDFVALTDLYNAAGGPRWLRAGNWLGAQSVCAWEGVTCSGRHVTYVCVCAWCRRRVVDGRSVVVVRTMMSSVR